MTTILPISIENIIKLENKIRCKEITYKTLYNSIDKCFNMTLQAQEFKKSDTQFTQCYYIVTQIYHGIEKENGLELLNILDDIIKLDCLYANFLWVYVYDFIIYRKFHKNKEHCDKFLSYASGLHKYDVYRELSDVWFMPMQEKYKMDDGNMMFWYATTIFEERTNYLTLLKKYKEMENELNELRYKPGNDGYLKAKEDFDKKMII